MEHLAGRFGGAAFVLFYMAVVFFIGIPALMAEWVLGRHTSRGTLGAFEKGGLPERLGRLGITIQQGNAGPNAIQGGTTVGQGCPGIYGIAMGQ